MPRFGWKGCRWLEFPPWERPGWYFASIEDEKRALEEIKECLEKGIKAVEERLNELEKKESKQ